MVIFFIEGRCVVRNVVRAVGDSGQGCTGNRVWRHGLFLNSY